MLSLSAHFCFTDAASAVRCIHVSVRYRPVGRVLQLLALGHCPLVGGVAVIRSIHVAARYWPRSRVSILGVVPTLVLAAIIAPLRLGDAARWCGSTIVSGRRDVTALIVPDFVGVSTCNIPPPAARFGVPLVSGGNWICWRVLCFTDNRWLNCCRGQRHLVHHCIDVAR